MLHLLAALIYCHVHARTDPTRSFATMASCHCFHNSNPNDRPTTIIIHSNNCCRSRHWIVIRMQRCCPGRAAPHTHLHSAKCEERRFPVRQTLSSRPLPLSRHTFVYFTKLNCFYMAIGHRGAVWNRSLAMRNSHRQEDVEETQIEIEENCSRDWSVIIF